MAWAPEPLKKLADPESISVCSRMLRRRVRSADVVHVLQKAGDSPPLVLPDAWTLSFTTRLMPPVYECTRVPLLWLEHFGNIDLSLYFTDGHREVFPTSLHVGADWAAPLGRWQRADFGPPGEYEDWRDGWFSVILAKDCGDSPLDIALVDRFGRGCRHCSVPSNFRRQLLPSSDVHLRRQKHAHGIFADIAVGPYQVLTREVSLRMAFRRGTVRQWPSSRAALVSFRVDVPSDVLELPTLRELCSEACSARCPSPPPPHPMAAYWSRVADVPEKRLTQSWDAARRKLRRVEVDDHDDWRAFEWPADDDGNG